MAIGPQSRDAASGRLVVIAALHGIVGAASMVLAAGPFLEQAGTTERILAGVVALLGTVMLIGALSVGLRIGPARTLGVAGALAMTAQGLILLLLATLSLSRCGDRAADATGCYLVVGAFVLAGLAIAGLGIGSAVVIRRARQRALGRRG